MAKNSGDTSADIIISKILEQNEELDYGWDFKNQQLTRLIEAGIIDPVKVTRTALQNAASCASTLITTNHGIIQTGE
jgi:chaperonin GroEL